MDCKCKILSRVKSGPIKKSPPNQKMKKGMKFEHRYGSLSWLEICKDCSTISDEIEAGKNYLVLCYYKDDSEKNLKGNLIINFNIFKKECYRSECNKINIFFLPKELLLFI